MNQTWTPQTDALYTHNTRLKIKQREEAIQSQNPDYGTALVNLDTGEITRVPPNEIICTRKIPKKPSKPADSYWYFDPSEKFIKLWDSMFKALIDIRLTGSAYNILLYLAQFVSYNSCVVMRDDLYITADDIANDMSMYPDSVSNALKSLRKAGIIASAKTGNHNMFIINPFVLCPGKSCNATLLDTFKNTPLFQKLYVSSLRGARLNIKNNYIAFPRRARFVKLWLSVLPHILDIKLSGAEITVLLACLANLRYESCEVAHSNGKLITAKGLAEYTGLALCTVYKSIERLKTYDLLIADGRTLSVSPFLAVKGDKVDIDKVKVTG